MTNKYIEEIVEKNLNKKYKHLQKEIERVVAIALSSANNKIEELKKRNELLVIEIDGGIKYENKLKSKLQTQRDEIFKEIDNIDFTNYVQVDNELYKIKQKHTNKKEQMKNDECI